MSKASAATNHECRAMNVAIIDTGISNIGSVRRAIAELGSNAQIVTGPEGLEGTERIVLPGVGSFGRGMQRLHETGLAAAIRAEAEAGKPLLGICLGMQLLATRGTEGGQVDGLGLIGGTVDHLAAAGCDARLPHMGWNEAHLTRPNALTAGLADRTDFYFVHSYALRADDPACIIATCRYGVDFPAIVARGNVFGAQFHPEKSAEAGFAILRNFLAVPPC
jgi:glutamine amidotransferase